jgi:hypothetical protein
MRMFVASLTTAVVLSMTAVPLIGQSSLLQGTWKANVAKSKYSPGPAPKTQTVKWEPVLDGLKFTVDTVNAQGQAVRAESIEKSDGSAAPVTVKGAQTPDTTRFLKRIDDRTYEDGDKVNGKTTITRRLVISPDGKTLTVTMKGTNAQGQVVNNVVVYNKQP